MLAYVQPDSRSNPYHMTSISRFGRLAWRLVLVSALIVPSTVQAQTARAPQTDLPDVTRALAITNARIVQAPGQVIDRGTVVVRNGLIEAVGSRVDIPVDARTIEGDTLVVYAGFIDGLSHTGIPEALATPLTYRVPTPADPPYDRAGIQPNRVAASHYQSADPSISNLRGAGFTIAHVVPRGRSLPGKGSLVSLGRGDVSQNLIQREASLFLQFSGAGGVYPSNDMAVLARFRQLYREAEQQQQIDAVYGQDARGLERPVRDEVIEALYPAVEGRRRVFVLADGTTSALKVHRAFDLQQQLGFQLALTGVDQAFEVVDRLSGTNVPLFLTLNLPAEPDSTDKESGSTGEYVADFRVTSLSDVTAEAENLRARQAAERERHYGAAGVLHRAGVTFGFSTLGVDHSDILPNLRRMVRHGLTEDAALAALTTHAAAQLGLSDRAGTIEPGKIANLALFSGSMFDDDSRVVGVVIDGRDYAVEAPPAAQRDRRTSSR